jgi:peptide-methionine (S)-S-oxide reductase
MLNNTSTSPTNNLEQTVLAGGCFWCLEAVFDQVKGVTGVVSGYAGGHVTQPSYEQVCTGTTGHAEVVKITFDPTLIPFVDILHIFFTIHDPTTLNRQGADVGTQYRSAIFYTTPAQHGTASAVIKELSDAKLWPGPVVTQVLPLDTFYPAEDYHQEYFAHHPDQGYCSFVIAPKVAKFKKKYQDYLRA